MWARISCGLGVAAVVGPACAGNVTVFGGGPGSGGAASSAGQGAASASSHNGTGGAVSVAVSTGQTGNGTSIAVTGVTATSVVSTGVTVSTGITSTGITSAVSAPSVTVSTSVATSSSSGGGGCSHDVCQEGDKLDPGCSPCAAQICGVDSYCCDTFWDQICVGEVESVCNMTCAGMLPGCDAQYQQGTPGYKLCSEVSYECALAFKSNKLSCYDVCQSHGGECFGAFDDVNDNKCVYGTQVTCHSMNLGTAICVCSRGCGGNDPCTPLQTCVNGSCQ